MEDLRMSRRYKNGVDRSQGMLLPPRVEEYVGEDNAVRAIDAYVESLDLESLGFQHATGSLIAGQPSYAPQALLKLY
jgi:transposase